MGKCKGFELWRQDDNGNRFLVVTFNDQAAAEQRLAELTHTHHKQIYWIRPLPGRTKETV